MEKQVLYRDENAFGSGVMKAKDVIMYEITELCNTDILDYCVDTYELSEELDDEIRQLISDMENEEEFDEDDVESIIDDLLSELEVIFDKKIKYVIWLATKEAVIDLYSNGDENAELTAYETSEIILSDLGYDGLLFAYEKKPKPVEE